MSLSYVYVVQGVHTLFTVVYNMAGSTHAHNVIRARVVAMLSGARGDAKQHCLRVDGAVDHRQVQVLASSQSPAVQCGGSATVYSTTVVL